MTGTIIVDVGWVGDIKVKKAEAYVPVVTIEIPTEAVKRMTLKDWRAVKLQAEAMCAEEPIS